MLKCYCWSILRETNQENYKEPVKSLILIKFFELDVIDFLNIFIIKETYVLWLFNIFPYILNIFGLIAI